MSVYKHKTSPFWHFDFQLDGRRFHGTTGATSRREAERVERAEREKARRVVAEDKAKAAAGLSDMTVDVACGRYWAEVGEHHVNSATTWKAIERFVDHFGTSRLADVSDADMAELVAKRRAGGAGPATVNRTVVEPLARIFGRAARTWGVAIPRPPNWSAHRMAEPRERVRELTTDEEDRLFAAIRPDYLPLLEFAIAAGVRQANALQLTWSQIDEGQGVIRIIMKGGEPHVLPISSAIREILGRCRGHHETRVFTYVVHQARGRRKLGDRLPITKAGLRRVWTNALEAAGIADYRWHDNRHTALTRVLRATGNLRIAQQLAGHRDITTTAKYSHALTSDVLAAMERVTKSREKSRDRRRKVSTG